VIARIASVARRLFTWDRDDDATKAVVAVTMAFVTLAATAVAFLQQDASIQAGVAERRAQVLQTEATGTQTGSFVRSSADYGVYRRWFEHLEASNWAADLSENGGSNYSKGLLDAMVRSETALAEWSMKHTALLKPPFYDPETRISDFAGYYAESQVAPLSRARLEAEIALDLSNRWDGRSSGYVTVLTLMAVSLFFLGLATTMGSTARRLFAVMGALFVVVSVGWTAMLALGPIDTTPPAAVDGVVAAEVAQARIVDASGDAAISESDRTHFEAALAAAGTAVAADGDYAPARLARAEIASLYADALFFRDIEGDRVRQLLDQATADYRLYLAGEPDDYSGWWNLGWSQFLAGDHAGAIASTDRAIQLQPKHFGLYLNRALAFIATGDADAAIADTTRALEVAAANQLDSDAVFFTAAQFNIGRLRAIWPDRADLLASMSRSLREGQVRLEALGAAAPIAEPAEIGATALVRITLQPDGTFTPETWEDEYEFESSASFAGSSANGVRLFVLGEAIEPGTIVSVRVWRNDVTDYASSKDVAWQPEEGGYMSFDVLSPYGSAGFPLEAGEYEMEVYLDGQTAAELAWTVTVE
jgi:tetratricopeptide (TPR) repeat protein